MSKNEFKKIEVRRKIWFVGPLPPPLNGQSAYNKKILERISVHRGLVVLQTGGTQLGKVWRALYTPWIVLFGASRSDVAYLSPPGQMGLWLFLPTVLAFRAKKITQFIHHHSYRSINLAPMASHCALAAVGGVFSRHVLLSEKMLEEYSKNYLSMEQKSRALVVPNAFLFTSETSQIPARQGPIKIGHISVMTKEKGVDYILKLIDLVMPSSDFQFVFAGPIEQSELFDMVQSSIKKYPGGVHWLGPVSGNEKEQFYDAIDILLLPSRLIDEADPLVILEAYSAGVAVMASDVGCISERIISKSYLLKMDCVADAESIKRKADELKKERQKSASRFQAHARWLFSSSKKQGEDLLRSILDGGS